MGSRLAIATATVFLLTLFSVPIGFLLYGGGMAALGGLAIIAVLIVFQLPLFLLFKHLGWIPIAERDACSSE